ncbi:MAG: hypothetical protein SFV17_07200 [Candidatus Obscuribacter sp.]|nr:hypothetical protein [Candidatus Obscuribacter sp.]
MKLVHFTKVSNLEKYRKHGIPQSRRRNRIHGVFAVPLLDFPCTAVSAWRRMLQSDRGIVHGGVVFEIPDDALIYYAPDWTHHMLGVRSLMSCREAEALVFEFGRRNLEPLTEAQRQTCMTCYGDIPSWEQPSYRFNLAEFVVPRRIDCDEIVKVCDYRQAKRPGRPDRSCRDWLDFDPEDLFAED